MEFRVGLEHRQDSFGNDHQRNTTTTVLDVPCPVLAEIFLRLPVKFILRAKSTCKLWHQIISEPTFAEAQRARAMGNNPGYLYRFRFHHGSFCEPDSPIHFAESGVEGMQQVHTERLRYLGDVRGLTPGFASSGGLVAFCLPNPDSYYVWNPIIGEKVQVPFPDLGLPPGFQLIWGGFGFSSSSKEYKIVHFSFPCCRDAYEYETQSPRVASQGHGATYSLGPCRNWKTIHHVPFRPWNLDYIDCNGTLFWKNAGEDEEAESRTIGSFDTSSEEFRSFSLPFPFPSDEVKNYRLVKLGDTIGCVCMEGFRRQNTMSIWRLRADDDVKEEQVCWVKEYALAAGLPFLGFVHIQFGVAASSDASTIFAYDAARKEFKPTALPLPTTGRQAGVRLFCPHAASLISPKQILATK
ncbi:F-box/kelch-repeat protein At3g23880-like [Coffea eugenioides]|uniref:F-box/kelch-repeat protein At3g23880-like n=1 Tax=Coffea arabica TaxID=13443 RepID=A0A6P6WJL2_COFAR|nr:F-box/kelch-repeat protein At3g23880-like [Coffea arabica]XP_027155409.1 F-box/kelch-repeat protein At3g23880-like [Coffea eugenioides]